MSSYSCLTPSVNVSVAVGKVNCTQRALKRRHKSGYFGQKAEVQGNSSSPPPSSSHTAPPLILLLHFTAFDILKTHWYIYPLWRRLCNNIVGKIQMVMLTHFTIQKYRSYNSPARKSCLRFPCLRPCLRLCKLMVQFCNYTALPPPGNMYKIWDAPYLIDGHTRDRENHMKQNYCPWFFTFKTVDTRNVIGTHIFFTIRLSNSTKGKPVLITMACEGLANTDSLN